MEPTVLTSRPIQHGKCYEFPFNWRSVYVHSNQSCHEFSSARTTVSDFKCVRSWEKIELFVTFHELDCVNETWKFWSRSAFKNMTVTLYRAVNKIRTLTMYCYLHYSCSEQSKIRDRMHVGQFSMFLEHESMNRCACSRQGSEYMHRPRHNTK